MFNNKKLITIIGVVAFILLFLAVNPFAFNDASERTVVTRQNGEQFVRYNPGFYYQGLFAKSVEYPNQISVSYKSTTGEDTYKLEDNTIEIGQVSIRFNDATTADVTGITQYMLPLLEKEMIDMHNAHKSVEGLVKRRLAPYTMECLQSSAQLLGSEMCYSGGRAQMVQDYLDQLKNGSFLLRVSTNNTYDTIEKANKKSYDVTIQLDKGGQPKRKFSSIKEYGISVMDAQITNIDYEMLVDSMISKKVASATKASISKQDLITAQQQALTAKAQGEKKLVEIEYNQRQDQTKQVVAAQTQVELAKQDLMKQDIALQAGKKEAEKIKVLADANAYEKQRMIQADGGLDPKLEAYKTVQKYWADAMSKYAGNLVPSVVSGNGGYQNGGINFMEMMGAKAAKDLALDLSNRK